MIYCAVGKSLYSSISCPHKFDSHFAVSSDSELFQIPDTKTRFFWHLCLPSLSYSDLSQSVTLPSVETHLYNIRGQVKDSDSPKNPSPK